MNNPQALVDLLAASPDKVFIQPHNFPDHDAVGARPARRGGPAGLRRTPRRRRMALVGRRANGLRFHG